MRVRATMFTAIALTVVVLFTACGTKSGQQIDAADGPSAGDGITVDGSMVSVDDSVLRGVSGFVGTGPLSDMWREYDSRPMPAIVDGVLVSTGLSATAATTVPAYGDVRVSWRYRGDEGTVEVGSGFMIDGNEDPADLGVQVYRLWQGDWVVDVVYADQLGGPSVVWPTKPDLVEWWVSRSGRWVVVVDGITVYDRQFLVPDDLTAWAVHLPDGDSALSDLSIQSGVTMPPRTGSVGFEATSADPVVDLSALSSGGSATITIVDPALDFDPGSLVVTLPAAGASQSFRLVVVSTADPLGDYAGIIDLVGAVGQPNLGSSNLRVIELTPMVYGGVQAWAASPLVDAGE